MLGTPLKLRKVIDKSIGRLDDRSAKILINRYGLYGEDVKTLASLGSIYGITRERVRQIEECSMDSLREYIDKEEIETILSLIHDYLGKIGGLRREDLLVRDLRMLFGVGYEKEVFRSELRLIARVQEEPEVVSGDDYWHDIWHNDAQAHKLATSLVQYLLKFKEQDFMEFLELAAAKFKLPEDLVVNYLLASKRFGVGPYGDLGAKHWARVHPKTVRDKNFLVLRKAGAPMHFREIALLVNKLDKKQSHPATVHNELIKDPRFTLVGRGTYALKEHLKK